MTPKNSLVWIALAVAACGPHAAPVVTPTAPPPAAVAETRGVKPSVERIDAELARAWARRAVQPAPAADDATFLRRVTLDLAGTIPRSDDVLAFLADRGADKRDRAIERLLASPEYVEHWTNYWDSTLLGLKIGNRVDRAAFRAWLRERIAAHVPWNQLVYELLSAEGKSSPGGSRKERNLAITDMGEVEPADDGQRQAAGVNGAANFVLKFVDAPADYPSTVSRVFLGVQIQCAQCHDHKTEAWKQTDFQKFAAGALHFKLDADKAAAGDIQVTDVKDSAKIFQRVAKDPDAAAIAKAQPTALDGVVLAKGDKTREAFAAWITAKDSPYFAKAYVNRMWGHLFGRGFVDPVDDIRPGNAAQAPEVLELVTREFVASGYDTRRLLGMLARTRAYGLAAQRTASSTGGPKDIELFSSFRLAPLGPTELLGALSIATDFEGAQKKKGNLAQAKLALVRSFQTLFDVDEEFESSSFEGSLAQTLTLLNGGTIAQATSAAKGTALGAILDTIPGDEARVRALYVRVLSRPPSAAELARGVAFVDGQRKSAGGAPKKADAAAFGDLLFVLLNSSEFFFNH